MNTRVKSMKRLYEAGLITKEQLLERVNNGKANALTEVEYTYITGEEI